MELIFLGGMLTMIGAVGAWPVYGIRSVYPFMFFGWAVMMAANIGLR